METRPRGVVLDLDLGTVVANQAIECLALRPTDVRRRHHAEGNAVLLDSPQGRSKQSHPAPHDKCAQQVDRVGRVELSVQFVRQRRLTVSIRQERRVLERRLWAHLIPGRNAWTRRLVQRQQLSRRGFDRSAIGLDQPEQLVGHPQSFCRVLDAVQSAGDCAGNVARQYVDFVSDIDVRDPWLETSGRRDVRLQRGRDERFVESVTHEPR